MELSLAFHPQFLLEQAYQVSRLILDDQDFRYPELRESLIQELQLLTTTSSLSNTTLSRLRDCESVMKECNDRLSWIEQGMAAECHERWRLAHLMIQLEKILGKEAPPQHERSQVFRERARKLFHLASTLQLSKNPSWIEIVAFRWKFSPLFQESEYLAKVLDQAH